MSARCPARSTLRRRPEAALRRIRKTPGNDAQERRAETALWGYLAAGIHSGGAPPVPRYLLANRLAGQQEHCCRASVDGGMDVLMDRAYERGQRVHHAASCA